MAWGKFQQNEARIFYLLDNVLERSVEASAISMIDDLLNQVRHRGNNKFAMIVYSSGKELQWKYVKPIDRFSEADEIEFDRGQVPMIIRAKDILRLIEKDSLENVLSSLKEQIIVHFH